MVQVAPLAMAAAILVMLAGCGGPGPSDRPDATATPSVAGGGAAAEPPAEPFWVLRVVGHVAGRPNMTAPPPTPPTGPPPTPPTPLTAGPGPDEPGGCKPPVPEARIDPGQRSLAVRDDAAGLETMRLLEWRFFVAVDPTERPGPCHTIAPTFRPWAGGGTLEVPLPHRDPLRLAVGLGQDGVTLDGEPLLDGQTRTYPVQYVWSGQQEYDFLGQVSLSLLGRWDGGNVTLEPRAQQVGWPSQAAGSWVA